MSSLTDGVRAVAIPLAVRGAPSRPVQGARIDSPAIREALSQRPRPAAERRLPGVACSQEPLLEGGPAAETAGLRLEPGVPPLGVFYVYMTEGCNLACQHCWVTPTLMRNRTTGGHVTAERLLRACRDARAVGLGAVKLTGGEPLLHPEFAPLVYGMRELGLRVWMETNLTLLTPATAVAIRDTMTFLSTSLDAATEAEHDAFRGIPGSFRATCEAIPLLAADVQVQVIMSVHRDNAGGIEDLIALARRLGARSVKFNLVRDIGRADQMRRQGRTLDVRELIRLGRLVEEEWGPSHGIETFWSWPPAFQPIRKLLRPSLGTCGIHGILGVLASGHYALCGIGRAEEELVYGTLQDDVVELWNRHPTLRRLREELPEQLEGICGRCLFKRSCKAHCVASNYHSGRSLKKAHWFCEDAHREGLFPESRLVPEGSPS